MARRLVLWMTGSVKYCAKCRPLLLYFSTGAAASWYAPEPGCGIEEGEAEGPGWVAMASGYDDTGSVGVAPSAAEARVAD